jgi:hypothetical protein
MQGGTGKRQGRRGSDHTAANTKKPSERARARARARERERQRQRQRETEREGGETEAAGAKAAIMQGVKGQETKEHKKQKGK